MKYALAFALMLAGTAPAFAMCDTPENIHKFVEGDPWFEEIVAAGITVDDNGVQDGYIEVFASANGLTWTVVQIKGDQACIQSSGANWAQIPFVPQADRTPKTPS